MVTGKALPQKFVWSPEVAAGGSGFTFLCILNQDFILEMLLNEHEENRTKAELGKRKQNKATPPPHHAP